MPQSKNLQLFEEILRDLDKHGILQDFIIMKYLLTLERTGKFIEYFNAMSKS